MVGSLKCALLPEHRCALKLLMSLFSFLPVSQDGAAAEGGDGPENSQDLTVFVQSLLQQMQGRFGQMSDAIIGRIDEMGNRIDDLEKSIGDLMAQAGVEDGADINGNVAQ